MSSIHHALEPHQMWEGSSRNVRSSASTVPPNSAPRKMLNTS